MASAALEAVRGKWRLAFSAVLALAFVLYVPSLGGEPVWDDHRILSGEAVGSNTLIGAWTQPFLSGYFRPLVSLTLGLENRIWQGQTFYYHLTNVLLHVGACAALMGLLLEAFNSRRIAILGGFVLAVHPVQASTTAWIGARTDALSIFLVALFGFLLVLAVGSAGARRSRFAWASAVVFLAAMLTKEQSFTLLPLVPLALWAFGGREERASRSAHVSLAAPFLAVTILFLGLWAMFYPGYNLDRPLDERVLSIGQTVSYYTLLLLLPTLRWLQTYTLGSFSQPALLWALLGYIALALILSACVFAIRKHPRIGWFGALLLLSLLPVSNIIPAPSLAVAPYRAGVACLGLAGVLASWVNPVVRSTFAITLVGVVLVWWSVLTSMAIPRWQSPMALFTGIVEADPSFLGARRNLGYALLRPPEPKPADAAEHVEEVLDTLYGSEVWRTPTGAKDAFMQDAGVQRRVRLNRASMASETWLSETFIQLGDARARAGDLQGSKGAFQSALAVRPTNFTALTALAQFGLMEGDHFTRERRLGEARSAYAEAVGHLRAARTLKPDDPQLSQMLSHAEQRVREASGGS